MQIDMKNISTKQKVLIPLIILALVFVVWQVYGMFFSSAGAPPAPGAAPEATTPSPTVKQGATPAQAATGMVQAQFPSQALPTAQESEAEAANAPTLEQSQYLQLIGQFQLLKMKRMLLEEEVAIATARQKIAELNAKTGDLGGEVGSMDVGDIDMSYAGGPGGYRVMFIDRQDGMWNATLSHGGRFEEVNVGSELADGTQVISIDAKGVVIKQGLKLTSLTFSGATPIETAGSKVKPAAVVNQKQQQPGANISVPLQNKDMPQAIPGTNQNEQIKESAKKKVLNNTKEFTSELQKELKELQVQEPRSLLTPASNSISKIAPVAPVPVSAPNSPVLKQGEQLPQKIITIKVFTKAANSNSHIKGSMVPPPVPVVQPTPAAQPTPIAQPTAVPKIDVPTMPIKSPVKQVKPKEDSVAKKPEKYMPSDKDDNQPNLANDEPKPNISPAKVGFMGTILNFGKRIFSAQNLPADGTSVINSSNGMKELSGNSTVPVSALQPTVAAKVDTPLAPIEAPATKVKAKDSSDEKKSGKNKQKDSGQPKLVNDKPDMTTAQVGSIAGSTNAIFDSGKRILYQQSMKERAMTTQPTAATNGSANTIFDNGKRIFYQQSVKQRAMQNLAGEKALTTNSLNGKQGVNDSKKTNNHSLDNGDKKNGNQTQNAVMKSKAKEETAAKQTTKNNINVKADTANGEQNKNTVNANGANNNEAVISTGKSDKGVVTKKNEIKDLLSELQKVEVEKQIKRIQGSTDSLKTTTSPAINHTNYSEPVLIINK